MFAHHLYSVSELLSMGLPSRTNSASLRAILLFVLTALLALMAAGANCPEDFGLTRVASFLGGAEAILVTPPGTIHDFIVPPAAIIAAEFVSLFLTLSGKSFFDDFFGFFLSAPFAAGVCTGGVPTGVLAPDPPCDASSAISSSGIGGGPIRLKMRSYSMRSRCSIRYSCVLISSSGTKSICGPSEGCSSKNTSRSVPVRWSAARHKSCRNPVMKSHNAADTIALNESSISCTPCCPAKSAKGTDMCNGLFQYFHVEEDSVFKV